MKMGRNGPVGAEIPVVLGADGVWRDASSLLTEVRVDRLAALTEQVAAALPPASLHTRWAPPLTNIGKIVCIGLNYRDHAAETGAEIPQEPIVFMKAPDTVVGATDDVRIPRGSTKTDWEVELAVVIGKTARYLGSADDSRQHVFAYAISHDVSERSFQLERGGQWDKGKNCETFNPLGPYLVTADEVVDPQNLGLRLWVNGRLQQDGSTADMIFSVDHLIWYLSQFMTLYPGDIINTGTPAGVALGADDTPFLRPDDVVELEIDGLGAQRQTLVEA